MAGQQKWLEKYCHGAARKPLSRVSTKNRKLVVCTRSEKNVETCAGDIDGFEIVTRSLSSCLPYERRKMPSSYSEKLAM